MSKRTFASVTDIECSCRHLERAAADPDCPIKFDARMNEYAIEHKTADGGLCATSVYHCPFCGGAAPESLRHKLFAQISEQEVRRLRTQLSSITSVELAIAALGQPDQDNPRGVGVQTPGADGQPREVQWCRVLTYSLLSDTADVLLIVQEDGKLRFSLQGKYIGHDAGA